MLDAIKSILGFGPKVNYGDLVRNGAIILDVRTPGEYRSGNIKGSINIPLDKLNANLKKLSDKQQPIITCCASGMRSGSAKSMLKSQGYETVHNGGGWSSLEYKLVEG